MSTLALLAKHSVHNFFGRQQCSYPCDMRTISMSVGREIVFLSYFYSFYYGVNFEFAAVAGFFWTFLITRN